MVNKQLQRLYSENLELKRVRKILIRDLEKVNESLDNFLNYFGTALLKKQIEIERLKEKEKKEQRIKMDVKKDRTEINKIIENCLPLMNRNKQGTQDCADAIILYLIEESKGLR